MAEGRLRSDRLILFGVALFLAGATIVTIILREVGGQELPIVSDRVLLTFVMVTTGVLVLGLTFVLLRNLAKLLIERRHEVLGSRFRTKLVFSFLILCLIPSVGLFYAAITVINRSVERMFTPTVEDLTGLSQGVADAYNDEREHEALAFARRFAREMAGRRLSGEGSAAGLRSLSESLLAEARVDFIGLYDLRGRPLIELSAPDRRSGTERISDAPLGVPERVLEAALKGGEDSLLEVLPDGQRVVAVAPVAAPRGGAEVQGVVATGYRLRGAIANRTARISEINREYLAIKAYRRDIKRLYVGFFLLLTLLILFSAVWLGMYLARQITVPIQKLAEGTREVASGNLDHRVEARAGDEIGELIQSFNRMTEDIRRKGRELEERRRYIEALLENVPAGVISLDPEGRISTLNRAAHRLLGIDASDELRGRPFEEAFSDPALAPLVDLLRDTSATSGIHGTRELALATAGRSVNLAASVSSFHDPEGRSLGSLVVLEDLTLLIRAQRSAAWREAARRIAHEIKNPLTPIQLSAQRILKKSREGAPDLPAVLEEGAAAIITEVSGLKAMVDEFSRFARVPPVSLAPADPRSVIESAVSLYDGTRPGIEFTRDYDGSPVQAFLDAEQMKRALINLIDNAIEAMPDGGTIRVATRHIAERGCLRIELSDNGPGIPQEDRERLFLPYFSTKRRGTGLGLAIVNRVVVDHGGTIRVEDNVPRGARFVIEIPCAGEARAG